MKLASHSKWPTARPLAAPVPGEPYEVLAPDVGSEEAGSDRQPTHIPAREKEVRAHVFLFARGPVGDPRQHEEVRDDHEDVDDAEVAHGVRSVREKKPSSLPLRSAAHPKRRREESGAFFSWPLPVTYLYRYPLPATCYRLPESDGTGTGNRKTRERKQTVG